ncbi:hypothetical protein FDI24_gp024 [Acidovorax phage ACP17]|uniref:Uncharacterized protein n=1 Tax=Acidovorax phage ACP17 TaxID=2010329 RepID=A0A218M3E3_9CAUD|nr:hypothetical protein FDI24_gp024 [Acidovorax phage ACP17]ASD50558.1 hypothetical protein [Acidovorax phage ACP17]
MAVNGGPVAVSNHSQEFDSMEACTAAAQKITGMPSRMATVPVPQLAWCVKK